MDLTKKTCRIKPRLLRVGYFNANGLIKQRNEIATFLREHQLDVFLIQETFLKPSSRSPRIANYQVVRNDRSTSALGGTLIYYKRSLHCIPVDSPQLTHIEASVCRLGMTGHSPIYIASVYLSPNQSKNIVESDIKALANLGHSVIIAGDLNSKSGSWGCNVTSQRGKNFENFAERYHFDIITPLEPTHFPYDVNKRPDILDIVLLKNVNLKVEFISVRHELNSDHRPVLLDLRPPHPGSDPGNETDTKVVVDWNSVEERLKTISSTHLDDIPDNITTSDEAMRAIDSFTNHVQSVVNDCSRQVPVRPDHRWTLPADVRALLTEKNAATRAYDAYPNAQNRTRLRTLQREVKFRIDEMRQSRWDNLLEGIEPSHLAFWQLTRSLRAKKAEPMPPLSRPNLPTPAFDDDEKAECMADSLESQCTPSTMPFDPAHLSEVQAEVSRRSSLPLSDPPLPGVTPEEVESLIKDLYPKKSPGSDGITNRVIKKFPAHLIALLAVIFNAAMSNCTFPQVWKEATVIGIHKPGKPATEPSSYRPISLLKSLGKLYERVLYARLQDIAGSLNLIPNEQFGFRAQHSCVQQVHRIVEHVAERFPQKLPTAALFFDVAKAFDKVWHEGLIYKLYTLGVSDRLVPILRDFLSNRSFRYRLEGTLSSPRPLRAGVPQGSVLSPILFSLYTCDIPKTPMTHLALFADDTAIYMSHRSPRYAHRILQSAVNALGAWFRRWRIEVNPDKSAAVYFSPGRPALPDPIKLFDTPIPWVNEAKYLGVILDKRLSFRPHVEAARNRAAFAVNRLHCLLHNKSKLSLRNKLTTYKTCIRPIMTYASPCFAHAAPSIIHRLQCVQNRFMRKVTNAPFYVRNVNLHHDLELPTIAQYLKSLSKRFFESSKNHTNELVVAAADYHPAYVSSSQASRRNATLRRPRHVLEDPDDDITATIAALQANSDTQTHSTHTYRLRRRGRSYKNRQVPNPLSNALSRGPCPPGRP